MRLEDLQNKRILILGLGREGKSALAFLRHAFPDARIGTTDKNDGPDYLALQKNYDVAVRTPGIPKGLVTIPSTTATNIFFECARGITIGITGTKGKSTTASLIHAMILEAGLSSRLAGNIGNPMLDELSKSNELDDTFVIELSSYQLDDIEYSPHISVILNIFPDHIDYHRGMENYMRAKERIVRFSTANDFFIFNPRYDILNAIAARCRAKKIAMEETGFTRIRNSSLAGAHNKENISAAVAAARLIGVSDSAITRAIMKFRALPHRLEYLGVYRGIAFYDDAISTTPESTLAAINSLPAIGTIFLGGENRGYDFSALARSIKERGIENIVLFPNSGAEIKQALLRANGEMPNMLETNSMRDAVAFAYAHTKDGNTCLLSCASPSYSLWRNFEEKGELFTQCVRELGL